MKFRNMEQLQRVLNNRLEVAMDDVRREILKIMYHEVYSFYTNKKKPKKYIRTGALGDTVSATQLRKLGDEVSFMAYLDRTHQYTTGSFNMLDVLRVAESSDRRLTRIKGRPGFWRRSTARFDRILIQRLKKYIKLKKV